MAGQVRVEGQIAVRPAMRVPRGAAIAIDQPPRFVSRGGEKLEAALAAFNVPVQGKICADVGASTGGFTDCLLQHGASRVYAIDVGHGVLHWRLRGDPRVVVMEKTNARHLRSLPDQMGLVTVDATFISLRVLLPSIRGWLAPGADLLLLVKPQFEAGRKEVGRGGVVRRDEVRRSVIQGLLPAAEALDLGPQGLIRSPLLGPKGNVEFLLWCRQGTPAADLADSIASATLPAGN
jgi:23S rRNA (cytidine1920-2'-O)/16S rRNA (cytidine1409-2'-O)-methyltransferase